MSKILKKISHLTEDLKGVWTLLNSTSVYLKTGKMFFEYEFMFKKWRTRLTNGRNNKDIYKQVKSEIIGFRKALRNEGHNLSMSGRDLKLVGYKSDDCSKYGFKRAVIYFGKQNISYLSGEQNHIELAKNYFDHSGNRNSKDYSRLHYIWFRWNENILEIAGSDTESSEHFEILTNIIDQKKMIVLSMLKDLH